MNTVQEELVPRGRDPEVEQRERLRYRILRGVYERGWAAAEQPVRALEVGLALGLSREELFRTVLDLTHRSFLTFCSAGPQVRITEKGVAYLERGARRRQSIREG